MGLPARNPELLVIQFREAASAAERTQCHGWGGAGRPTGYRPFGAKLWQLGEVRHHAGRVSGGETWLTRKRERDAVSLTMILSAHEQYASAPNISR